MVLKIRTGIGLVLILGRTDIFCLNKESFGFSTFANFILQINITLPDIFYCRFIPRKTQIMEKLLAEYRIVCHLKGSSF